MCSRLAVTLSILSPIKEEEDAVPLSGQSSC